MACYTYTKISINGCSVDDRLAQRVGFVYCGDVIAAGEDWSVQITRHGDGNVRCVTLCRHRRVVCNHTQLWTENGKNSELRCYDNKSLLLPQTK